MAGRDHGVPLVCIAVQLFVIGGFLYIIVGLLKDILGALAQAGVG